jgi:FkbM family methyltransferase
MDNLLFYDENNNIINHKKMEIDEQMLVKKYINPDDIVLELGARYGTVSCTINKILNHNNQVVVEPDKRVWKALEDNMKKNNCEFHIIKGFISKKKISLTNLDCYKGGYGSKFKDNQLSTELCLTLNDIKGMTNLKFNVLVADCEGFLERFLEENPELYQELDLIIFEADWKNECNYDKIIQNLIKHGFRSIVVGFQNVFKK